MGRYSVLFLVISLLFSTGCRPNGSFGGNYRSIEQLQLVHTLGMDVHPAGVEVSASAGEAAAGEENSGPGITRLTASGMDIPDAVATLQTYAGKEELYFAHTRYVLVGTDYAQQGLQPVIDYLEHSPQLRSDLPLFVVKNGSAKDLVTKSGGKDSSVFDMMEAVVRSCAKDGAGYPFTCGDIAIFNAERGSALACALEMVPTKDANIDAEEEEVTPMAAGYAIFKENALAGFISKEAAQGVNLLLEQWGSEAVSLELGNESVSLQFTDVQVSLRPAFGKSGSLTELTVQLHVEAELQNQPKAPIAGLSRNLEKVVKQWMDEIFQAMRSTETDFLGFGPKIAVKHPSWEGDLTTQLSTLLMKAEIQCDIFAENP